jgi:hypothetical protein
MVVLHQVRGKLLLLLLLLLLRPPVPRIAEYSDSGVPLGRAEPADRNYPNMESSVLPETVKRDVRHVSNRSTSGHLLLTRLHSQSNKDWEKSMSRH